MVDDDGLVGSDQQAPAAAGGTVAAERAVGHVQYACVVVVNSTAVEKGNVLVKRTISYVDNGNKTATGAVETGRELR